MGGAAPQPASSLEPAEQASVSANPRAGVDPQGISGPLRAHTPYQNPPINQGPISLGPGQVSGADHGPGTSPKVVGIHVGNRPCGRVVTEKE